MSNIQVLPTMEYSFLAPPMAEIQLLRVALMALAAIGGLVLAYLLLLYSPQASGLDFWEKQPRVGLKNQRFYWLRSTLKSFTQAQSMVAEGYAKVSPWLRGSRDSSL